MHPVTGEPFCDLVGDHVHRRVQGGGGLQGGQVDQAAPCQQYRPHRVPRGHGPHDDLRALGHEQTVGGLEAGPQPDVGQPRVIGQPRVVRAIDRYGA